MRDFFFHAPTNLPDALTLLAEHQEDGRPIAGGTALVVLLKQSLLDADHIISLQNLPGLSGIHSDADGLHIGALTTHREVETSHEVHKAASLLAEVYGRVATVRIRSAATVGGGLAHADPAQDPPAALIALDVKVKLTSKSGQRTVPISELFIDYYETVIQPGELLTEVIVPPQAPGARHAYLKFLPRTMDDYATVAVAAQADVQDGGGGAGPTAVHATEVENELTGKPITAQGIRAAAEAVASQVDPLDDFRGSSDYKRRMAVVFTRRALEQVLTPSN